MDVTTFITQFIGVFHSGLSSWALYAAIITLVIASMKVSFLDDLIWNRLGNFQIWFAPFLGLVGGLIVMKANGVPLTLGAVLAYVSAGAGAVFLHELLDLVKLIPGLGPVYVSIITVIESALGGNPVGVNTPVAALAVAKKA
jgi:hypothetical protein